MCMRGAENYAPPMTAFLNSFSSECRSLPADVNAYLESLFGSFLDATAALPAQPFVYGKGQFNISLYEAVFAAVCEQPFKTRTLVEKQLRPELLASLQADPGFVAATQFQTAKKTNVEARLKLAREILGA